MQDIYNCKELTEFKQLRNNNNSTEIAEATAIKSFAFTIHEADCFLNNSSNCQPTYFMSSTTAGKLDDDLTSSSLAALMPCKSLYCEQLKESSSQSEDSLTPIMEDCSGDSPDCLKISDCSLTEYSNGGIVVNQEQIHNTDSVSTAQKLDTPQITVTSDDTELDDKSIDASKNQKRGNELQTSLSRPRSSSASGINLLLEPIHVRKRSGSIAALTHPHKYYIPVDHFANKDLLNDNKSLATLSNPTFADFIQVRDQRKISHKKNFSPEKKMRRRLVYKNGDSNVSHKHISRVKRHYLADIFTTLVDLKWRWTLIIFIIAFVFTWLFFALIWWVIGFTHGDFDPDESKRPANPCVDNVREFATALLYSIETQTTIGYGGRAISKECPEAMVVLMTQSILGMLVQALMTGMIFAKLSRPKKRAETLMFSKNAVICLRDGNLCLMFRIGDMRSSHLIEAHVRAIIVRRRVTKEGEVLPLDHRDVEIGFQDGTDRLLIIWPVIVIHKIDENSPFWRLSKEDLDRENFELIVVLEGCIESTGMTTQARTSYLPGEILWGRRLERLVTFQKEGGEYQVDYTRFDNTIPFNTPTCSAKELAQKGDDDSDSDSSSQQFTLFRTNSIQTSEQEEYDALLFPEGATSIEMSHMNGATEQ